MLDQLCDSAVADDLFSSLSLSLLLGPDCLYTYLSRCNGIDLHILDGHMGHRSS